MKTAARWLGTATLAASLVAGATAPAQQPTQPPPAQKPVENPYFKGTTGSGGAISGNAPVAPGNADNPYAGSFQPPGAAAGTIRATAPPNPYTSPPVAPVMPGVAGPGYNPYTPYYPSIVPDSFGGYLSGAANVMNAQARNKMAEQESLLVREKAKQEAITTRRRSLEQYLWERDNLPTAEDDRQRNNRMSIARSLNEPPAGDVNSGKALNDVLSALQTMGDARKSGPVVPLLPDVVRRLNIGRENAGATAGLLRNEGKLAPPRAVRELARGDELAPETPDILKRLEGYTQRLYAEAGEGRVDAGLVKAMEEDVATLDARLTRNSATMKYADFDDAKKFTDGLKSAVRALSQPDGADMLRGRTVPRAESAQDLVEFMTSNGLRFAPASTGSEAAYRAAHTALVGLYKSAANQNAAR